MSEGTEEKYPNAKVFGYARVSTEDQNLDLQVKALERRGCDKIFKEKISAAKKRRRQRDLLQLHLRPGDTLVIWKLDRLGRSLKELIETVEWLEKHDISLESLTEKLDTGTAIGRMFFNFIAMMAQFERDMTVERTKAGIKAYLERGGQLGQPYKIKPGSAKWRAIEADMRAGEMTKGDICKKYKIGRTTLHNYWTKMQEAAGETAGPQSKERSK